MQNDVTINLALNDSWMDGWMDGWSGITQYNKETKNKFKYIKTTTNWPTHSLRYAITLIQ